MTGVIAAMLGRTNSILAPSLINGNGTASSSVGANSSAAIFIRSNGLIQGSFTPSGVYSGPASYVTVPTPQADIGRGIWVRATNTSGSFTVDTTGGTWYELRQDQADVQLSIGPQALGRVTLFTLDFSLDGGATIALSSPNWALVLDKI